MEIIKGFNKLYLFKNYVTNRNKLLYLLEIVLVLKKMYTI